MQMTFLARHDLAEAFKEFSVKEGLWRTWARKWLPNGGQVRQLIDATCLSKLSKPQEFLK
jgi:hypothetical protein